MHESKQKKPNIERIKKQANSIFQLHRTLRKLDLALSPKGTYNDTTHIFNMWDYAKRHGVTND